MSDENGTGEPVSERRVWGALSRFVHVTEVPDFTVSAEGSNAKFLIAMEFPEGVAAGGREGAGGVWLEVQPAAMQARTTRTRPAIQNTRRECAGILP